MTQATSERALAKLGITELAPAERPLSERYRLLAEQWCDANSAAELLQELKTTTLEEMKTRVILERGDMPDNRAERLVKSSPEWREYITKMCHAKSEANRLRIQMKELEMRHSESIMRDANARAERRF